MFDKVVTPFFLLYGLFYVPIDSIVKRDYVMFVGWLCWLVFSRVLRLAYYFFKHPHHVIYIPFFIMFQYLQAIIRVVALFTVYERGWGTRNIEFVGNTIQRNNVDDVIEVEKAIELQTPQGDTPTDVASSSNDDKTETKIETDDKEKKRDAYFNSKVDTLKKASA
jgi:hypothetical protein